MITTDHLQEDRVAESDDRVTTVAEVPPGPRRRLRWKIVAGVGILAALSGAAIAADYATNSSSHSTHSFVEPITTLDIDISSGSVRVIGGTASTVTVDVTTHGGLRRPSRVETVVGDRLVLRSDCDYHLLTPTCSTDYVIHAPANVAIVIDSDGADIDLVNVTGDVDMDLNGGDVDMQFASAPHSVEVDANGGDVDIVVPDDAATYDVESETNGGSTQVDVRTDRESPNHIDISTNGGDIDVRYPVAQRAAG